MRDSPSRLLDRLCSHSGHALRLVVVVAHPDDEAIGAGARLQELTPALLAWTTDGSPRDLGDARREGCATREEYAALRRAERERVAELLGVPRACQLDLGCVDQEASLAMPALARAIAELLHDTDADAVLTHPYEGGHPDHDATALAVHAACALLARDPGAAPAALELASYHARDDSLEVLRFLPNGDREVVVPLDEPARARKRALFGCYATQRMVLEQFPFDAERFRVAPAYDFAAPPHAGTLHYERYAWGMTGERWRGLAAGALAELGLGAEVAA